MQDKMPVETHSVVECSFHVPLPEGFPGQAQIEAAVRAILKRHCALDSLDSACDGGFCVHLQFVGDAEMKAINQETRGKDASTDVLSFPLLSFPNGPGSSIARRQDIFSDSELLESFGLSTAGGLPIHLGDIILSVPACQRQAEAIGHSVRDEFYRLLVHGLLHLFGYDHETSPEDQRLMEEREDRLLEAVPQGCPQVE